MDLIDRRNKMKDYYKNLPKKRMGVGALLFNEKRQFLIVKPNYKTEWSIPGGVVEENESPLIACIREVKEEIGLDIESFNFLAVEYKKGTNDKSESLQFIFSTVELSQSQILKIRIDGKELIDFKFVEAQKAAMLLEGGLKERMPLCLKALEEKRIIYIENSKLK